MQLSWHSRHSRAGSPRRGLHLPLDTRSLALPPFLVAEMLDMCTSPSVFLLNPNSSTKQPKSMTLDTRPCREERKARRQGGWCVSKKGRVGAGQGHAW